MQQQIELLKRELAGAWRFRWWAVGSAWAVALVGWFVVAVLPNVYEARARVYVDASSALRPLLEGIAVEQNVDAQLQFVRQTLLSRPALERVAKEVDLDLDAETPEQRQALIERLQEDISIQTAPGMERSPDKLYVITYKHGNRDIAVKVVTNLLNTFVEGSLGAGRQGSETAQRFLRTQISEYEARLNEAEAKLADFKRRNVGLMPGEQGDYFSRVQAQNEALKRSRAALLIASNRREALLRQLRGEMPFVPGAMPTSPRVAGAPTATPASDTALRLKESQGRLEELRLRFTDRHPEIIALQETIVQLEQRLREEQAALQRGDAGAASLAGMSANPVYQTIQMQLNQVDVEIAALRGEISDRERAIAELNRVKDLAPEIEAEFARLTRDYGTTRAQYDALVGRLETARISEQATETGTLRFEVIDPPVAGFQPVEPNRPFLGTAVFVFAVGFGVGLAWLLHQIKPVFSTPAALGEFTGLPVLGSISRAWEARATEHEFSVRLRFFAAAGGLVVAYGVALLQGLNLAALARLIGVSA